MISPSQGQLWGLPETERTGTEYPTALEVDLPLVEISRIAQAESWRKEVHRPASHTHKWWAQRLGSVFRSILIASLSNDSSEVLSRINTGLDLKSEIAVLDVFAGSGTTLVEALKLGARATGIDINPVAGLVQRQAMQPWSEPRLVQLMKSVEDDCRREIAEFHLDSAGNTVLYYFWVARASCPACQESVDLFSDFVFARHAYPRRFPIARAVCPSCDAIQEVDTSRPSLGMCVNGHSLDAKAPVRGSTMTCSCGHQARVVEAIDGTRPQYRMYAKLVLKDGEKSYEPVDDFDLRLYDEASRRLHAASDLVQPTGHLDEGYNTRQATRWGFNSWRDFFNDRQLYCLGLIGRSLASLEHSPEREALCALFSGTLEFNNMFCSYKGEGTGAVRHMFSHHILKPERTPLEAHPWGTSKSSGSFSTLFRSRILRALEYKAKPHDIALNLDGEPERRFNISCPIDDQDGTWEVITGDAATLPHVSDTFDLVVTDPPYFNNVHYSELADFFHAWLRNLTPHPNYSTALESTRSDDEVQSTDVQHFGSALGRVYKEAARVLKDQGILAFSFHHGSAEAWLAVCAALRDAGFTITSVQPVKAEMSTSSTKSGAKEPNDLDSIVICRPADALSETSSIGPLSTTEAADIAIGRLDQLRLGGIRVGLGDVRSVVTGSVIALTTSQRLDDSLDAIYAEAQRLAEQACSEWG